ncbi:S26 family signal peptidase [Actinokineospora enzanensis]|uniref:S26 family signal peptidase n=1 Tax=Actinokineospora enzanensis TaxID=155975 RepID=UPI0003732FEE|nr:S26 family signal peptidase [Actinokineospora enzanensis]
MKPARVLLIAVLALLGAFAAGLGVLALQVPDIRSTYTQGGAMYPTVWDEQSVRYESGGRLRRGDVIVVGVPDVDYGTLVGRVVGIAGDTVECCDEGRRVRIGATSIAEDYLSDVEESPATPFQVTVPDGSVLVAVDTRSDAPKLVPSGDILGRATRTDRGDIARTTVFTAAGFTEEFDVVAHGAPRLPWFLITVGGVLLVAALATALVSRRVSARTG